MTTASPRVESQVQKYSTWLYPSPGRGNWFKPKQEKVNPWAQIESKRIHLVHPAYPWPGLRHNAYLWSGLPLYIAISALVWQCTQAVTGGNPVPHRMETAHQAMVALRDKAAPTTRNQPAEVAAVNNNWWELAGKRCASIKIAGSCTYSSMCIFDHACSTWGKKHPVHHHPATTAAGSSDKSA